MKITHLAEIPAGTLLDRLRDVRLVGYPEVRPYADAQLTIEHAVATDRLAPTQRYLLTPSLRNVETLRASLLDVGVDILALGAGYELETADHLLLSVLPPIVEESVEQNGQTYWIINDGQHRVYAARQTSLPITVVVARGVDPEFPYYAYPLADGWSDVQVFDELPDGFLKKHYRQPEGYQRLYRDFEAAFPGVQPRRRDTNPSHLKPGV